MTTDDWIAAAATDEEAFDLMAQLVSYRSYPGEEGDVQLAVGEWLRQSGLEADIAAVEPDRPNIIARIVNGDGPTFLLNGHVDTVLAAQGWSCDPWKGRRDGDRFYGLGAYDMKGGVAAAMLAARALHRRRDAWRGTIIFSSVVDEEAYSIGARALVDARIAADYCVVTEPFWDGPIVGGVGKVLVRGDVIGRAAHGSWPRQGVNAAVEASKLLARLDDMPLGTHPRLEATQCVLSLHSGSAQYVITVPEHARFLINRHTVPGETGESVLAEMRALADSLQSPARFEFAIDPPYYPSWEFDPQHPFVQRFARAFRAERGSEPTYGYAGGVADANYFAADLAIPTVMFGPAGAGAHQSDEWVDIPSIAGTTRVVLRLATDLLAP